MLINAKLIFDGEELKTQIEIDEADLKAMWNKEKTRYERVGDSEIYYWVDNDGLVGSSYKQNLPDDDFRYDTANYYSSKDIAENNARADQLMRQLRRFAVENREKEMDWNNSNQRKYFITYDNPDCVLNVASYCVIRELNVIYFDSKELAERAIEEFNDELIWYFTEYKDSL